jgi:gamma-glutamylcyclotransferase (GGCT)/AIG2-like uncharacterized protein YtfP
MTSTSILQVFVYGTLKPGETNYQHYCGGKVKSATPVYTRGNLYSLPVGYPALTEGNNKVKGVLLTFGDSAILSSLDSLEGYQPERAADLNEYERLLVSIYSLEDQNLGKAWAYFMSLAKVKHYQGTILASGWWTGS